MKTHFPTRRFMYRPWQTFLALILCSGLVAGCANTSTAHKESIALTQMEEARAAGDIVNADPLSDIPAEHNVVIIRDRAEPFAWNVSVRVDGEKQVGLANNRFTSFRVEPGQREFEFKWSVLAGQTGLEQQIEIDGSRQYFVYGAFYSNFRVTGTTYSEYGPIVMTDSDQTANLTEHSEPKAVEIITYCCRYTSPRN